MQGFLELEKSVESAKPYTIERVQTTVNLINLNKLSNLCLHLSIYTLIYTNINIGPKHSEKLNLMAIKKSLVLIVIT